MELRFLALAKSIYYCWSESQHGFAFFLSVYFLLLFVFFPYGLFPFLSTADHLQLREIFAITYF